MSIQEFFRKLKGCLVSEDVLITGVIVLTGISSFFLGRYSHQAITPVETSAVNAQASVSSFERSLQNTNNATSSITTQPVSAGAYVASKTGTKYHLPWCPGAKQIKETNKIWFQSKEDAEKAGYTPASNCKGI